MHGNAVGTAADGFLNGAYEAFLVGVAGQGCGSGKMDDEAKILAFAGSAEAAAAQPFMHQDGISAAVGHVGDCLVDILNAFDRADGDAVIHRNDDGAAGFTIEDALETDLLAEVHGIPSFVCLHREAGAWIRGKKKGRGFAPAALNVWFCFTTTSHTPLYRRCDQNKKRSPKSGCFRWKR